MSKKLNQVFIVWAHTGEYEDRQEWILAVFDTEEKAEQLLTQRRQEFDALGLHEDGINDRADDYKHRTAVAENTLIHVDYTGVSFSMTIHDVL